MSDTPHAATKDAPEAAWERAVRQAVRALRYGSVEVQVHDGRVVQVETREKVRFADHRRPDDRKRNQQDEARADRNPGGATGSSEENE
jgi:hypothetical protein